MRGSHEFDDMGVDVWLAYARNDLAAAERLHRPPSLRSEVCFHCQQAAEKALKAYLVRLGTERVPRTHDLEYMSRLIAEAGGQPPPAQSTEYLHDFAVVPRYPGTVPPTEEEAEQALAHAHTVVAFVERAISQA